MIQERYCSYEVARLLKEKGFDWNCITYYVDSEPNDVKYSMLFENNTTWESMCCSAPTHQMACDWLREKYKIEISIVPKGVIVVDNNYYNTYKAFIYMPNNYGVIGDDSRIFTIYNYKKAGKEDNNTFDSYEEAVEAVLKYCLTNLI